MARTKKEIDKEMMYKKIMPSATRAAAQEEEAEPAAKAPARSGAKNAPQAERFAGAQLDKIAANVRKKVAQLAEEPPLEPLALPRDHRTATPVPESATEFRYAPSPYLQDAQAPHTENMTAPPLPGPETEQPFAEVPEHQLVNQMEQLVAERLDAVMEKFHCCRCDKCRQDMIAISLNKLRPHYIVVGGQAPVPAPNRQTTAEVTTALIQAVLIVKAHPRH